MFQSDNTSDTSKQGITINATMVSVLMSLTSRAQALPPGGTTKTKMTNKSHKINRKL
jgi:hypothetical protein